MKLNVEALMTEIERYIAKADEDLEETLTVEGFVAAKEAVKEINTIEDAVTEALGDDAADVIDALSASDDVEVFLSEVWGSIKSESELKEKIREIFYKEFRNMMNSFTYEWILSSEPSVAEVYSESPRVTAQTHDFISGWSTQLADLMHLSTHEQIESVLRKSQKEHLTIEETADLIAERGIREAGYRARRVATTEVLRMESYTHQEAMVQNPLTYAKRWKHVMSAHPRVNHMAMNGQEVFKRETFTLTGKDGAIYHPMCPRDTNLPAGESVNCHCVMEEVKNDNAIGMTKEELRDLREQAMAEVDAEWQSQLSAENALRYAEPQTINNYFANLENDGIIKVDITDGKQFGKKSGKHCADYGFDPSTEEGRGKLKSKIMDITYCNDEVRVGPWRGQEEDVLFYVRGDDAVVTKKDAEFVTIMKGAAKGNARVKNARKQEV